MWVPSNSDILSVIPLFLPGVTAIVIRGTDASQAPAVLQGVSLSSQDCLREIQGFLKKHMDLVSMLLGTTICFTVTVHIPSRVWPQEAGESHSELAPGC